MQLIKLGSHVNTRSFLLAFLLISGSAFAQQLQPPANPIQPQHQLSDLDVCAEYAIKYALLLVTAHAAPNERIFDIFVNEQLKNQRNQQESDTIHKFAEEAWRERNIPPSVAGVEIYQQCERSVVRLSRHGDSE